MLEGISNKCTHVFNMLRGHFKLEIHVPNGIIYHTRCGNNKNMRPQGLEFDPHWLYIYIHICIYIYTHVYRTTTTTTTTTTTVYIYIYAQIHIPNIKHPYRIPNMRWLPNKLGRWRRQAHGCPWNTLVEGARPQTRCEISIWRGEVSWIWVDIHLYSIYIYTYIYIYIDVSYNYIHTIQMYVCMHVCTYVRMYVM